MGDQAKSDRLADEVEALWDVFWATDEPIGEAMEVLEKFLTAFLHPSVGPKERRKISGLVAGVGKRSFKMGGKKALKMLGREVGFEVGGDGNG